MYAAENMSAGSERIQALLKVSALGGKNQEELYPGRRFFGYFCSYWPEELVLAAGMEPIRLLPDSGDANPAELPAYCCSLARGCLAGAIKGAFRYISGIGFAHTCDTMQCLGGIWEETMGSKGVLTVVPPVMLDAPGASAYYKAELVNLLAGLSEISGTAPGPGNLQQSLELCAGIRHLAAKLDDMRPLLPSPLVAAVLRAGQLMPRTEYAAALEAALPDIEEMAAEPSNRQRILVSGAVLENNSLYEMVEELGGRVVADDTCTGIRHFAGVTGTDAADPMDDIVSRYIGMPPCPCRNRGMEERNSYISNLAAQKQARGAVLIIRKYCDPHTWDAVPLEQRLRATGIRTMVLELEGASVSGQERTRLQAFMESLD